MAFSDTNRDKSGNPVRDPTGTDPHSHSYWTTSVGLVIAAILAFLVFTYVMRPSTNTLIDMPSSTSTQPLAPAPAQPTPAP